MGILFPVLVFAVLGVFFGLLLGYANDKFNVEVDERVLLVREVLPSANCGGCGFPGCDGYADAVSRGEAPVNLCTPSGSEGAKKIAEIMGVSADASERKVAYVKCKGTFENTSEKFIYHGIKDCREASLMPGMGSKSCEFGCLGLGTCANVCKFDALNIVNGVANVDEEACTGCGACAKMCPKLLIHLIPKSSKYRITCSARNRGKAVSDNCKVGCIGCTLCQKNCPEGAIVMNNELPVYDYGKCTNCGICKEKCPRKPINFVDGRK